ncbi:Protein stu1 [Penicillium atrosanguineum]|nr:Protein stu1 [Penicillium atrosanguineum]
MEAKAAELLAAFKNPNISIDSRVNHLTSIKSDIKQKNVPEGAIPILFEAIRLAITSQHYSVSSAGFSTLGHYLKRLSIQDQQQHIANAARGFYPLLMERLGDHKERIRAQSASIFTELWPVAGEDVEYYVLQCAMVGKNPRAKEMSMLWLSNMTKNHGLLFRSHVPSLVACLEDADSAVRDTARLVVVELFRNASARAKSDLQKQLAARSVRKSIANAILSGIGLGADEPQTSARPLSRAERPISVMSSRSHAKELPDDELEFSKSRPVARIHHDRSAQSVEPPSRPKTPAEAPTSQSPSQEDHMLPWFDGKESEDNWLKREKNVILFRRLTCGNAPHDFSQSYLGATKTLLDGIFKVIAAQNGNATVEAVLGNATYSIRIMQHVHWACQDKNVQVRLFAAGWLRMLIIRQAHQKSTIEHGGGLDLIEKSIKKGLGDANPGAREGFRSTFWTFYGVWPSQANAIMADLDAKSRSLLEKDASNPNGTKKPTTPAKGPGGPSGARSALRDVIAARKKAAIPSRPESAQSAFDTLDPAPKPATRSVPTGAPLSSLSSAPMRPGAKPRRAEISRPATADPYASRPGSRAGQSTSKPASSPRSVRSKASTPSSKMISAPRLRPHEAGQTGTTRGKPKKLDLSKSKSHGDLRAVSHSRSNSDDSIANQHAHHLDPPSAPEDQDSPALVVLESPPLAPSQPPSVHRVQPEVSRQATPEPEAEPQTLSLEEPRADTPSPRAEVSYAGSPLRHSVLRSEPEPVARSQPEEMVIYEDPATPVAAGADVPEAESEEPSTPEESPRRAEEQESYDEPMSTTPARLETPAKNPALELAPTQGTMDGSPSPSRNWAPATPSGRGSASPHRPAAAPVFEGITNNENATAQLNKLATPRSVTKPGALEEVPLNETISQTRGRSAESPSQSTTSEEPVRRRKWAERHRSPSPRSKDPGNAQEMLGKALSRIGSKTIDISGYRKLQGLFQYHGEEIVTRNQDYYAMLDALLGELESAPTSRKDHDVKTQILATIRSMLLRTSELFHRYDVRAMAAVIRARRHYESSSHFVTCLEEVAEQLASLVSTTTVIDGVLRGLDMGEDSHRPAEISDDTLATVGTVVSQQLGHPRPGVRKQATELCTLLNLKFGLDRVQKATPPAGEGSLNLLTYFMARRSR